MLTSIYYVSPDMNVCVLVKKGNPVQQAWLPPLTGTGEDLMGAALPPHALRLFLV